jgi:hypothetical protein
VDGVGGGCIVCMDLRMKGQEVTSMTIFGRGHAEVREYEGDPSRLA